MSGITMGMVDAIIQQLKVKLPHLAIEYFPEKPESYRLNHALGALLVSYSGADFHKPDDTGFVVQERVLTFSIAAIVRQLNGRNGAVEVLDQARVAIVGYKPPNCRRKIWALREKFLGQSEGLWQYALDIATIGIQVEDATVGEDIPVQPFSFEESQ